MPEPVQDLSSDNVRWLIRQLNTRRLGLDDVPAAALEYRDVASAALRSTAYLDHRDISDRSKLYNDAAFMAGVPTEDGVALSSLGPSLRDRVELHALAMLTSPEDFRALPSARSRPGMSARSSTGSTTRLGTNCSHRCTCFRKQKRLPGKSGSTNPCAVSDRHMPSAWHNVATLDAFTAKPPPGLDELIAAAQFAIWGLGPTPATIDDKDVGCISDIRALICRADAA